MKTKAAFIGDPGSISRVFGKRMADVAQRCELYRGGEVVKAEELDSRLPELAQTEIIFSTWGMPKLTPQQLAGMPRLKAVFYAAGTVKSFAQPLLDQGVKLVSAWAANALPVAEFSLAQIILSCKGYFRNVTETHAHKRGQTGPQPTAGKGSYGETVAILGAGMIGRRVIELLKPIQLNVVVFDPFLSDAKAAELGAAKVTLEQAFARGYVVSNHIADVPETRGLLRREHFASMRADATFINTGRGATVVEPDLVAVMRERPDLTALLDVTWPEPPPVDSPLWDVPNIRMSSHIAGSLNDELTRMADFMLQECDAFLAGKPLRYEVTAAMLSTMA